MNEHASQAEADMARHGPIPPDSPESQARAKADAEAERHAVLMSVKGAREAALYLLDFYPEAAPALVEFIALAEEFGYATFATAVRQAKSERYGPSSQWDPRR